MGSAKAVEVVGETVNAGQRLAVIAVQVPLDAFQFALDRVRFLVVMVSQSLGVLPEHGEPHGQMEPVEDVLGTGGTCPTPSSGLCRRRRSGT